MAGLPGTSRTKVCRTRSSSALRDYRSPHGAARWVRNYHSSPWRSSWQEAFACFFASLLFENDNGSFPMHKWRIMRPRHDMLTERDFPQSKKSPLTLQLRA
jgi:hypothetical protein